MSGSIGEAGIGARYVAVYACSDVDYSLPSKITIKDKHLQLMELVG